MKPSPSFWFRISVLIFAIVLAVQAAWLTAAELTRPTLPYFPKNKVEEENAARAGSAAILAASIGLVRGSLWIDAAIALSSGVASNIAKVSTAEMKESIDYARAIAERAARLSPHDSRIWLLLATLDSRLNRTAREIADQLKMSYYTGPNELALMPLRIRIATGSTAIGDADLQILVAQEIRTIVLRHQDQNSSVLAAYRDASPEGKQFIESTVGDLDKGLLETIRATDKRR
jgi:hypothetical protein